MTPGRGVGVQVGTPGRGGGVQVGAPVAGVGGGVAGHGSLIYIFSCSFQLSHTHRSTLSLDGTPLSPSLSISALCPCLEGQLAPEHRQVAVLTAAQLLAQLSPRLFVQLFGAAAAFSFSYTLAVALFIAAFFLNLSGTEHFSQRKLSWI